MSAEQIILAATSLCGLSVSTGIPADEIAESLELSGLIEPEETTAILKRIAILATS